MAHSIVYYLELLQQDDVESPQTTKVLLSATNIEDARTEAASKIGTYEPSYAGMTYIKGIHTCHHACCQQCEWEAIT